MKILISGGTGLIGSALAESLYSAGHQVTIISRDPDRVNAKYQALSWDESDLLEEMANTNAVINLAGASLAGENPLNMRWTPKRKQAIISSRTLASAKLLEAIRKLDRKPEVFLQASAIGFYGNKGKASADETTPAGDDFLSVVCREWEASSAEVAELGVRRLVIRIGLVLSQSGGLLPTLSLPFRFFVGGRIGKGDQYLSWIDIEDIVSGIEFLINDPVHQGVYNLCSPSPVTNLEFSKVLGKTLRRSAWLPVPAIIMRIMLGEAATLALDGRPVHPARLLRSGFQFRYPQLENSLKHLLNENSQTQ